MPYTRINLKVIKNLYINCDGIKILQENISIKSQISPRAREIKEKINKWDYIKLNSFCTAKETIIRIKREPTIWENIFANDTSNNGLISKIYNEHI